ncbi:Probable transcriptional regulator%2C LysR family [Mycobacterium tuberculosis]|nr:Probable transcriptional regulator%2C LysR family [Mycobacterium tuberculosis]
MLRERGTVTAAADALPLTPSTVSQQLRQLAKEPGGGLLEAQGRRVRLTAAAHTALRHADAVRYSSPSTATSPPTPPPTLTCGVLLL